MKNEEFITGKVPITKEEVRAVVLSKLDILKADSFLDIGSGTGSVSIEAALSNQSLDVVSIDSNSEAKILLEKNIEKFKIDNIRFIEGKAPVSNLDEKFDSIFIGGSGSNLESIVRWSFQLLNDGGKIAANFIIHETFCRAMELFESVGFKNIEVIQMSVNVLSGLGKGKYFKPQNPIFIISAEKQDR